MAASRKKKARSSKKVSRHREGSISKSARAFHKLIRTDGLARKKLYDSIGRVRCYLYKYGRSTPKLVTQKKIEKLTKGAIKAPWS